MYARLLFPVGLLLLAACGAGDDDRLGTAGAPGGPAAAASTPVEGPASPAEDPAGDAARGVVRDARGAPVSGVMVRAVSLATPSQAVPELAVVSDARGRYAWPAVLPPGPYELRAETPDGPAVAQVQVRRGRSAAPVDLRVPAR